MAKWLVEAGETYTNWSGYMHLTHEGTTESSSIEFLPVINANPNDLSTVYISIMRAVDDGKKVLTFDQPLWIKGIKIILERDISIILRLGGFHLEKSFLGCIGYIMEESGLEEVLGLIYGKNTVIY